MLASCSLLVAAVVVVDVDDAVPFSYSTPSLYLSVDLVRPVLSVGLVTVHVEREARVDSRLIAEAMLVHASDVPATIASTKSKRRDD